MGYRHNLGILTKARHTEIKNMTIQQLEVWYQASGDADDGDPYVPCYNITKEVYEFGKYYDDAFLKDHRRPVFTNEDVDASYQSDTDFYLISQAGFKAIINDQHRKIADHYEDLLNGDKEDDYGHNKVEAHIRQQLSEWSHDKLTPYSLTEGRPEIVSSWKYEYTIFELARLYKAVDWKTELVTITAW